MQRREVLRLLATGAALQLTPTRLFAVMREARSLVQAHTSPHTLNTHQYETVKVMAEMIIPRTDTPGATDVGAADFIDLVLTEWCDELDCKCFVDGLGDVDARAQSLFGKDFVDCSALQQADILTALGEKMVEESKASPNQPARLRGYSASPSFYPMFRRLTLTAYYTSEAGATNELHFEIIPGEYQGCAEPAPVKEASERP